MKKLFSFSRLSVVAAGCVLLLASSCKKTIDSGGSTSPVSGLMAFNLVTDKPAGLFITLSNANITRDPLVYTGYTGTYLSVYTGLTTVNAYDAANVNTPITNSSNTFEANKYYSLFIVGANNTYSNVMAVDNFDSLSATSGKAFVRYINAIPDSSHPRVVLTANGTALSDLATGFKTVSAFTAVTPGSISLSVNNSSNIQASRTITVEQKKAYTFLLVGTPGATDSLKTVQVKFIENGTLAP